MIAGLTRVEAFHNVASRVHNHGSGSVLDQIKVLLDQVFQDLDISSPGPSLIFQSTKKSVLILVKHECLFIETLR